MDDDDDDDDGGRSSASGTPKPQELTPFEKFEELTKRLVKVPKSNVDSMRKHQQKRERPASS
jgi:hypothetical protein